MPNYCGRWATAAASLQLSHRAPALLSPLCFILSNRAPGKVRGGLCSERLCLGGARVEMGDGRATSVSPARAGAGGDDSDAPCALECAVMRLAAKPCPVLSLSQARPGEFW